MTDNDGPTADTASAAITQHPVGAPDQSYPLTPPLTAGVPDTETETETKPETETETEAAGDHRPLEVGYEYESVNRSLFETPPGPGLDRWQPLLPPLVGQGLGAGGTPLLECPALADWAGLESPVYLKDESQNPTWSHKDRLNRLTVGAAVRAGADGVVAASTGNHGASAAAHAARNNLGAVVFTVPGTPPAMEEFIRSYGAAVVQLRSRNGLVDLVDALAERSWHPVTTRTPVHTGHPYGPEGYKTIAYESYQQLGRPPAAVFVPTAYAELLYGVWKGFRELAALGAIDADARPTMVACEPAEQAAFTAARQREEPVVEIDAGESAAHSIGGAASTYRGYLALKQSAGSAVPVPEETIATAQTVLSRAGHWQEFSGAAGAGGLAATGMTFDGPVVVLACSAGYKDGTSWTAPRAEGTLEAVAPVLADRYGIEL